MLAAAAVFVII